MKKHPNSREIVVQGNVFASMQAAATKYGISRNTIDYRLCKDWTPEEAVGIEPRPGHAANTIGVKVNVKGQEFSSIRAACEHYSRAYTHVIERLQSGCPIEVALGLVTRNDTLCTEYPQVAEQWHPTKNQTLTPDDVSPHSGRKVWWTCENKHEWKAVINSRTRQPLGCPYCAGQKASPQHNFAVKYPELLHEWDWGKNSKRPDEFTPRSSSKVWWLCKKNHSWQATINNRTRDSKNLCPYCENRKLGYGNSLGDVRPDLAAEWHPKKNDSLTPMNVIAGGTRRVWWICKHDHEWQATVGSRVISSTGCPKCSLQTSRIEIAIYSELKKLVRTIEWRIKISNFECDIFLPTYKIGIEIDGFYWHSKKPKQDIKKSQVFEDKGILLFRVREEGLPLLTDRDISYKHAEPEFAVVSRLIESLLHHTSIPSDQRDYFEKYLRGDALVNEKEYRDIVATLPAPPPGKSFKDKYPHIAEQWAFDLNVPLTPEHFWPYANKYVWWRCSRGHKWRATINNRSRQNTGCPDCINHTATESWNLAISNPNLSKEWHPTKNKALTPKEVSPDFKEKIWWLCDHGHAWQASILRRESGAKCPSCYGRFATVENNLQITHPELIEEWDVSKNKSLAPSEFSPKSSKKIWWLCKKGHSWQAIISNRTDKGSGCSICARNSRRKYSIEYFQKFAKERGGVCLSTSYQSGKTKLEFKCDKGHFWVTRADNVQYNKIWCRKCKENGPRDSQQMSLL